MASLIKLFSIYRIRRRDDDRRTLKHPVLIGRVIAELGWAGSQDRHAIKPPFQRHLPEDIRVKFRDFAQ